MSVRVFEKPHCPQCEATKRWLTRSGVAFETVDLTKDESAHRMVLERGFQQAPVVDPGDGSAWWSGFRVERLRGL